ERRRAGHEGRGLREREAREPEERRERCGCYLGFAHRKLKSHRRSSSRVRWRSSRVAIPSRAIAVGEREFGVISPQYSKFFWVSCGRTPPILRGLWALRWAAMSP